MFNLGFDLLTKGMLVFSLYQIQNVYNFGDTEIHTNFKLSQRGCLFCPFKRLVERGFSAKIPKPFQIPRKIGELRLINVAVNIEVSIYSTN